MGVVGRNGAIIVGSVKTWLASVAGLGRFGLFALITDLVLTKLCLGKVFSVTGC